MILLDQAITLPFTGALAPMEPLRKLVLSYAHSDPEKAPAGVVWRVMQTDLRSLFPPPPIGEPPLSFTPESRGTQAFFGAVKQYESLLNKASVTATKTGVPPEQVALVRKYLNHWLPYNRIAGLCALVLLCAMRRS